MFLPPNWPISLQIYASLTILGTIRLRGLQQLGHKAESKAMMDINSFWAYYSENFDTTACKE